MPLLLEHWKPVVGFEGFYEVSNVGNLRTLKPRTSSSRNYPYVSLRPDDSKFPYLIVTLNKNRKIKVVRIHQVVAAAFIGDPPPGHQVNHKDTFKSNNRASNLEYTTHSGNMQHAIEHGLRPLGSEVYNAVLDIEKVREIREMARTRTAYSIAQILGLKYGTVKNVVRGRTWKHLA